MFIAFSGLSGSGKNTIMNHLVQMRKDLKILTKSTATTRKQREDDKENNIYVFLSKSQFEQGIKDNIFIEYQVIHDNYYGTLIEAFEKALLDKENHYMRDIDVKGMLLLKKFFGEDKIVSIFLDVPDNELQKRLKKRGESDEQIKKRLSRGELERSYKKYYDLVVENVDLNNTLDIITKFLDEKLEKK